MAIQILKVYGTQGHAAFLISTVARDTLLWVFERFHVFKKVLAVCCYMSAPDRTRHHASAVPPCSSSSSSKANSCILTTPQSTLIWPGAGA